MKKLKWNPEIFDGPWGCFTDLAFDILNDSFSDDRYGYSEILSKGVMLVSLYFQHRRHKEDLDYKTISEFLEKIEKAYYEIKKFRIDKDIENKLNKIDKDF